MGDENKLTDEQIEELNKALDEVAAEDKDVQALKDASGEASEGEAKKMQVVINPETGEHIVIGEANESVDEETFEEMVERVTNSDIKIDDSPFTENELESVLKSDDSVFKELSKNCNAKVSPQAIKDLLVVVNRKLKKEEFNTYKALPQEIKDMIDKFTRRGGIPINTAQGNQFRNLIADQLVQDFITNIGMDRIQHDFSKELEDIFDKSSKEISESIVGYTIEREKTYREAAEKMDDPEKKEKVLGILDRIHEAYELTELKEFSKKCKIKKYDLERPDRAFKDFASKYKDSKFNVYGIDMAVPVLVRNLNKDENGEPLAEPIYTKNDVNAFFIAFTKQTQNMNPESDVMDHAYMYYVMYNAVFTDINTGKEKNVSDIFLSNIKEIINNLRTRNNDFK
jgi:hypothetical protein